MICVEDQCLNVNRILLLSVGLWPYQKSKLVRFQLICFFSILITCIIFQFATLLTSKCTKHLLVKIFSFSFILIIMTIIYNSFYINSKTVKYLMEELQHIYADLKDNEMLIIEKYKINAKYYTIKFTMLSVCSAIAIAYFQLWPEFLDIILPINESRPRRLLIAVEYFIDQERYFYFLLLHIIAATFIGLIVFVATSTMLVVYFKHACGMFRVASYRFKHAMEIYILKDINWQKEKLICENIIYAVDIHRKAMKFCEYLISRFQISLILLIMLGVIALSLNIFCVVSIYNVGEFMISLIFVLLCVIYMFLSNSIGQDVTDHYNHIFITVYEIHWYRAPLHIQKLILFILKRGNKTFNLKIGGLFVPSLQNFSMLINTSISYFAVIYSI